MTSLAAWMRRVAAVGLLVTALALSPVQVAAGGPDLPGSANERSSSVGPWRTLTLLTGDRVRVDASGGVVSVEPGEGRARIAFTTTRSRGRTFVLPSDAASLIASGRLDERLFDITTLLEFGYDDARREDIPLIVEGTGLLAKSSQTLDSVKVHRALPAIGANSVSVRKRTRGPYPWPALKSLSTARNDGAAGRIWLDGKVRAALDTSVPRIGAPTAWARGLDGSGVKVAILDTGVDETHPDLRGKEVAAQNFTSDPDGVDHFGHGTHVASIVAGSGVASGGRYRGVAPGAMLLDGKVLSNEGFGLESWIIAGMTWATEQGAKVVNLSLGGSDTPGVDPLEEAVNTLSATSGAAFVVAAGNSGRTRPVSSPGSADAALTVGGVDSADRLATFSSRGPRVGDGAVKPDITAPGVGIVAARAALGSIGDVVEDGYVRLSGTSMATPHVAGASAILAQQHPEWSGATVKAALMASARPNPSLTAFEQGAGRLDVARAISQVVISEPASVSFGIQSWPHDDDEPIERGVTYRNLGSEEVALDLSPETHGPEGQPAPPGMLRVAPQRLVVPAGGTATATLTADTRVGSVDGLFSGALVASGGGQTVRTPSGVTRESETFALSLRHTDRDGKTVTAASGSGVTIVQSLDTSTRIVVNPANATTLRLPRGRYAIGSQLRLSAPDGQSDDVALHYPQLDLTHDVVVTMDARRARQVTITPPGAVRSAFGVQLYVRRVLGDSGMGTQSWHDANDRLYTAQFGPSVTAGTLGVQLHTAWEAATSTQARRTVYRFAHSHAGSLPTGFTRVLRSRELARVDLTAGASNAGASGWIWPLAMGRDSFVGPGFSVDFAPGPRLPQAVTQLVNTDVRWMWNVTQVDEDEGWSQLELRGGPQAYKAGKTYRHQLNRPVYGPAMPNDPFYGLARVGDTLFVNTTLFGDSSGNAGYSYLPVEGSTALFRNGERIGQQPTYPGGVGLTPITFEELPMADGVYRLTTTATRTPDAIALTPDVTSTTVTASWTFRSRHLDAATPVRLPMSVLSFAPPLDATNTAPAGRQLTIPFTVRNVDGDGSGRLRRLSVEVSYDQGESWRRVRTAGQSVIVRHPAEPSSVSLRAKGSDHRGNSFEQTILNAYRTR